VNAEAPRRLLDQALAELDAARRHLDFSADRVRHLPGDLQRVSDA